MKTSKFNLLERSKQDAHISLLYNTLHDHQILFDDPELDPEQLFSKINQGKALTAKEAEVIPDLKELGIIINDEFDEEDLFKQWYFDKIRDQTDSIQVTILPAMGCNLACHYCFENEVRENGLMKPEVTEQIIGYLKNRLQQTQAKKLSLHFFGGEPLIHPEPIKRISQELWEFCQKHGVEMSSGMITNGVFLTPDFVDFMTPYGFKWVKITFDGDREEHDKKRVWHNGKGTFDTIYNNLAAVHGKIKIAIGGNFDENNYSSMFSLIDRLKHSPFADDITLARFKPIMSIDSKTAAQDDGKDSNSLCESCSFEEGQIDKIRALEEKTRVAGLPVEERPEMGPCEYHARQSFTIGPDGSIYNCPAFVGLHNLAAGHVKDEQYNEIGEAQLDFQKWDDDCDSCAYLPNCVGGCRYNSVNKTGSLKIKSCDISYLKKATEVFMQRKIEEFIGKGTINNNHDEEIQLPTYGGMAVGDSLSHY